MDDGVSLGWHEHARQHVDGCRLSCSVMAQKCDDLVLFDAQRKFIDGSELTKDHGHMFELNGVAAVVGLETL